MIKGSVRIFGNVKSSQVRLFSSNSAKLISATGFQYATKVDQKLNAEEKAAISNQKTQLKELKQQLVKEKSLLSKLSSKYKQESKKLKSKEKERSQKAKAKLQEKKAKENEKKIIAAATKTFRKLSAYNYFVKENATGSTPLKEVTNMWNQLTFGERERYQDKADDYNEEMSKIYTPKPKAPANGYASYVQENYAPDGRSFGDINKELAAEWRALNADEKAKFTVPQYIKEEYLRELKEWTEQRLKLYRQSKEKAN